MKLKRYNANLIFDETDEIDWCKSKDVDDDAYSLLAEVRALKMDEPASNCNIYVDGYNKAIEDVLDILSEHFR